jgi:hypothetical protein
MTDSELWPTVDPGLSICWGLSHIDDINYPFLWD